MENQQQRIGGSKRPGDRSLPSLLQTRKTSQRSLNNTYNSKDGDRLCMWCEYRTTGKAATFERNIKINRSYDIIEMNEDDICCTRPIRRIEQPSVGQRL